MSGKHVALLALIIGGLAAQLASISNWSETVSPTFVAGLLTNVSAGLVAVFVKSPAEDKDKS